MISSICLRLYIIEFIYMSCFQNSAYGKICRDRDNVTPRNYDTNLKVAIDRFNINNTHNSVYVHHLFNKYLDFLHRKI